MKPYDFLIVGSGLFGATCANLLKEKGFKVLVLEKRNHIGGNSYTINIDGINVHKYGAHIFHTSDEEVWEFVNRFATFNCFVNSPLANYHGKLYHLPFNMYTFCDIWEDVKTKEDAIRHIESEKKEFSVANPSNLEEQAISLVGKTIYQILIKEYTEKQWGRDCSELPAFIIKRLPVRFEFNNNYFNDKYQGIPIGGYTNMIENMLNGVDIELGTDYLKNRNKYIGKFKYLIFTGSIDEYFDYKYGALEYRSLEFIIEKHNTKNYQNNAVINYTSHDVEYTRIIEHKFFEFGEQKTTVISKEYPRQWHVGLERFYPINNARNDDLYKKYAELAFQEKNVFFGGRLGLYKYLDMDKTIKEAINLIKNLELNW